jgi:hypothetical protein
MLPTPAPTLRSDAMARRRFPPAAACADPVPAAAHAGATAPRATHAATMQTRRRRACLSATTATAATPGVGAIDCRRSQGNRMQSAVSAAAPMPCEFG